jgi:ferredoxin
MQVRHPGRPDIYAEAAYCRRDAGALGFDAPLQDAIDAQVERYRAAGFPGTPFFAGGIIVRRENAAVRAFNELWWREFRTGGRRDQFSLAYAIWKSGVRVHIVEGESPLTCSWFGFSFHAEYALFKEIIDSYDWDMCLIQLNILDDNHQAGLKGLRYAADKGVSVAIMEPLKGGLLGSGVPDAIREELDQYGEKRSLPEWAFRWLYQYSEAKVVLSGVSSMEQLQDAIRIAEVSGPGMMSETDMQLIARIKAIYQRLVRVGCTGCGYCMPCPAGVNIPEIFKVYNDAALSSWTEFGKTFYSLVARHSGGDASLCVCCGACEAHCPQKLAIPELLETVHRELLG